MLCGCDTLGAAGVTESPVFYTLSLVASVLSLSLALCLTSLTLFLSHMQKKQYVGML